MSKKKNPSDEELSDVKVEVPRQKKHRRETETGEVVRHKRRDAELSDVKVEGARHKPRRVADPSDDRPQTTRHKKRRDVENGDVATHKPRREADASDVTVTGTKHKTRRNTHTAADAVTYGEEKRTKSKASSKSSDYVFDNKAYVGSVNNLVEARNDRIPDPPTRFVHTLLILLFYRSTLAICNRISCKLV